MNYLIKIIFLISYQFLYSNEILEYSVSFRNINVGEAILEFRENVDSSYHNIKSNIKSNKYISYLYNLNDYVDLFVNTADFSTKKVIKNINQGTYKRNHVAEINNDTLIYNGNKLFTSKSIYDPIALVYYLRNQSISLNEFIDVTVFDIDVIRNVRLALKELEVVKVPFGEFKCKVYKPSSIDGSPLFKNNGLMTVWVSNDALKIPLQISQKTNLGDMVLKLKNRKSY